MFCNRDIVIVSGVAFHDHWTCKQEIARVLARSNRVLFVSEIPRLYRYGELRLGGLKGHLREEFPNLFVFYPPAIRIPLDFAFKPVNDMMQKIAVQSVKRIVDQLGFCNPLLWLFDCRLASYVGAFGEACSIYHCVDRWDLLLNNWHCRPKVIKQLEHALVASVDLILTTADDLRVNIGKHYGRDATYIPHGVDFDLFKRGGMEGFLPPDIANLPRPILGFIGTVGDWVDCQLILDTARTFTNASVVLIGPVRDMMGAQLLNQAPNISVLGSRPKQEVPNYIRAFDVCLLPFKLNDLTKSVNPLKALEYLSSGKPLVSTALAELSRLDGVVYVANDLEGFIAGIRRGLAETGSEFKDRRVAFAQDHTWERQLQKACDAIVQETGL